MSDYVIYPYDCVDSMLWLMDEKSVHSVVTSPPYFNLRDYGTAQWEGGDPGHTHDRVAARNGRGGSGSPGKNTANAFPSDLPAPICSCGARRVDAQIGREKTPGEYVDKIVEVFRAIRRVLRDDGTVWLVIGDTYANDSKWGGRTGGKHAAALHGTTGIGRGKVATGLKSKELIGIPWRVAFALQDDGWYLRQDVIWNKPNTMPESVRDRLTSAHEYIFLLSKSPRYYFDVEAIKEPSVTNDTRRPYTSKGARDLDGRAEWHGGKQRDAADGTKRRKRDVWTVPARAFGGSHFATFPPALIEPCILAGSPPSCCAKCGAPRVGKVERTEIPDPTYRNSRFTDGKTGRPRGDKTQKGPRFLTQLVGYVPSCECGAPDAPALIFDPFGGTGTTAMVALRHGRQAALCEINPEYIEMAHKRIAGGR